MMMVMTMIRRRKREEVFVEELWRKLPPFLNCKINDNKYVRERERIRKNNAILLENAKER